MESVGFAVQDETLDDVRVIAVQGELDLSTAPQLEEPLDRALAAADPALMIDLSDCVFMDSTGIAVLVKAWQRLDPDNEGRARLALCGPGDQVRRVLDLTGLDAAIPMYGSRESALAELRG